MMALLCHLICDVSCAQSCVSIKYDDNGNRVQLVVDDCGKKIDVKGKDMIRTGLSEKKYGDEVLIFPNPSKDIVNVKIDAVNIGLLSRYEMYNVNGVLIDKNVFQREIAIDVRNHPSGVYLLKVTNGDDVWSKVVVKL